MLSCVPNIANDNQSIRLTAPSQDAGAACQVAQVERSIERLVKLARLTAWHGLQASAAAAALLTIHAASGTSRCRGGISGSGDALRATPHVRRNQGWWPTLCHQQALHSQAVHSLQLTDGHQAQDVLAAGQAVGRALKAAGRGVSGQGGSGCRLAEAFTYAVHGREAQQLAMSSPCCRAAMLAGLDGSLLGCPAAALCTHNSDCRPL